LDRSVCGPFQGTLLAITGETMENHGNTLVKIANKPAKVWTKYLLNSNLDLYHYTNQPKIYYCTYWRRVKVFWHTKFI